VRRRSPSPALLRHRLSVAALALALPLAVAQCGGSPPSDLKVIVLGMDGLDFSLTEKLMAEGRLPNFERLAEMGGFSSLETTVPAQSPVAWSTFMTGLDPGGHGIFDFLHRDPKTLIPYSSTAQTEGASRSFELGGWKIPLGGGKVESLRQGTPFWTVLEENGIETTILRMPANYPPSETATRELTGMGTPDLTGTDGTFSFYTSELFAFAGQDVSGGNIYELDVFDNIVEANLYGPDNPLRAERQKLEAPFRVYLDPEHDAGKLELGDQQVILEVGEWSGWLEVQFPMVSLPGDACIPGLCLRGMCRVYLKQVRPELELYVTAIEADPFAPDVPVSSPADYAAELAEATGRFHTKGMPEDTKTMTEGIFEMDEFLEQAHNANREIIDQYPHVLASFESGLLFYYFGNIDQVSHIVWRSMDPEHPAYDAERDRPYADVIPSLYEEMDEVVGYTLDHIDDDTLLVVMSDHGFTSWRRSFHLNNWLRQNGYLVLESDDLYNDPGLLLNVDWSRTRAYAFGFNGLYVNLAGREKNGIVGEADRVPLLREIAARLLEEIDPKTGTPAITKVHLREDVYADRQAIDVGPDLLIGYAEGVRPSNQSALGELSDEIMSDNLGEWSGDHMMDHETVPGILLTNRPLDRPVARIHDLAGSILHELGVDGFPRRQGDT
jgi:predicted AlkP superfamily phosphohydrolase/phosphomutase